MNVKYYPLGELGANCCFVTDSSDSFSLVVDPGAPSVKIEELINDFGSETLKYILLTHGHFDHIGNAAALKERFPASKIVISREDEPFTKNDHLNLAAYMGDITVTHFTPDIIVSDNDVIDFGSETIRVISTPGHTAGSVCYVIGDSIFTGDTLMKGTTGRVDFPTGSSSDMRNSLSKLSALKEDYKLYCGHGESSTLHYEKKHNIFLGNKII